MKKVSIKSNFLFKTKADTLKQLVKLVERSKIEKIYVFTVEEWQSSQITILKYISNNFNKKIIVRSSAVGEDSATSSQAGSYESILNVNASSKREISNAINSVISSYKIKNNRNNQNQILIQSQTLNVVISGVVFTRTPDVGSPYFVINFEEGKLTTGVTKGSIGNTTKIFRKINHKLIPQKWANLIVSIKEIEKIVNSDKLDIEFGITKNNQVVIFQVRPLTSIKRESKDIPDNDISKIILKSKKQFKKLNNPLQLYGNKTIFSDMADWNPAEIIGNNPNILDYSLYDFLIMKNSWSIGRTKLGYQNVKPYRLMRKFGSKPYVDTRGSFNSLIPDGINQKLKKKLVNFYLKKLTNNPHLHDKVEFDILFTCYDFTLPSRLSELKINGFSKFEISEIEKALLKLTIEIIEKFPKISSDCLSLTNKMSNNRKKIESELEHSRTTKNLIISIEQLLNDCKKFGAVPFSAMARMAFIGSVMLKSLQKQGYLDSYFVENFMNSISSPLSEIQDDMNAVINNKLSKKQFLKKYGHLRPGTYDITARRYDIQEKFFDNVKFLKIGKKNTRNIKIVNLDQIFLKHNLKSNTWDFLNFVEESLVKREQLKFEFTKNLSYALELIAEIGTKLNFSREEMACLDIKTILKLKNHSIAQIRDIWTRKINQEKIKKTLNDYVVLPPLIFSEYDFEIIQYNRAETNYVTSKKLTSEIIHLKHFDETVTDLNNKIILIENADPGYDWVFTKNLSALITKYGGVASHMSIRCAEIGLPAAIGCGEILFEKLKSAHKILLDCKNKEILILEYTKYDNEIEARKILKSLGYIK
jgi:phosphoenolpyruvate synthase/pyruvate phosphate dikinase